MFAPLRRFLTLLVADTVAEHAQRAQDAERESCSLRQQFAAYQEQAGREFERLRRTRETAKARCQAAINEAGELKQDLAGVRLELDKTMHGLSVAEEENRRLWALAQRDQARVERERAMHDRRRAEFENPPAKE
jgi:hypothetical protein